MYITIRDYAERNGFTIASVRNWVRHGKLPAIKSGATWLVDEAAPRPIDRRTENHDNRPAITSHTCKACGKSFDGGPASKFCPSCRAERKKAYLTSYYVRKNQEK